MPVLKRISMSRNYEKNPEMFPVLTCGDYDPDADGWKADARAEPKAMEQAARTVHSAVRESRGATSSKLDLLGNVLIAAQREGWIVSAKRPLPTK
jgi:hypothetical protein